MNIKKLARLGGAATIAVGIAAATVIPASAADNMQRFGVLEKLDDGFNGTGYTVTGLHPSAAAVPAAGHLWEATVTVDALWGWVTPLIPMFNARAENGQNYRVIDAVSTPDGLSGAALPPGGTATGKLYFDVVGAEPNSVVYN
ncbi:MAG: hypothetical protein QOD39_3333, partial [Mycobacterium sp.]|nr:hypothetical protein [Mycobacterium sp.]